MIVKIVGRDRKDKSLGFTVTFDNIVEATRYLRTLLIDSIAESLIRGYEIVITIEDLR